jgi:hypothetical protein
VSRRTKPETVGYSLLADGSIRKRFLQDEVIVHPVWPVDVQNYSLPYRKYSPLDLDYTRAHRDRMKAAHVVSNERKPIGDVKLATLYALTALGKHVYAGTASSKRKKR